MAWRWAMLVFAVAIVAPGAKAEEGVELPLYKMVRSLQMIQDQVITGDRKAAEMQRFLLTTIDKRLRDIDMDVFDDARNIDAALIYAMAGGNPQTLDILAERDIVGYFDNRVTSVLRRYLKGQGGAVLQPLRELVPEYRNSAIGPYIELIGANALMNEDPKAALKFFSWARLEAPGTIIEEAAIRRSLLLSVKSGDVDDALTHVKRYARRFMGSPYAAQFADIFIDLAVDHSDSVHPETVEEVLAQMERTRQREVYLRLARRAAIDGNRALAALGAQKVRDLSLGKEIKIIALSELYSGLVNIPTDGVDKVVKQLAGIRNDELSPKDRFLKSAAEVVAAEVLRAPDPESLMQVRRDRMEMEYRDDRADRLQQAGNPPTGTKDPETTEDFVAQGRFKLKAIDALLRMESN